MLGKVRLHYVSLIQFLQILFIGNCPANEPYVIYYIS